MPRPERDVRVLAAVAAYLRHLGVEAAPIKVKIECNGDGHVLRCGEDWPDEPAQVPKPRGKWLSPLGQRIVDYVAGAGLGTEYVKGEVIANALGEPYQHRFKALMADLVERDALDALSGSGYRLMPADGPKVPPRPARAPPDDE